jgi:hypothetical protein
LYGYAGKLITQQDCPRLAGITKLVSKLSKEMAWRKALEVYEAVEDMG